MIDQNYGRVVLTSSVSGIYGNFGQANYGAAKMGMLGLMNVLEKEGAPKNVRVNVLAPAAETRLIGTIPGMKVNPDDPDPMRHPKLVTPAVLLMCAEDAPNGKVIHAGNGRFSCSAIFTNDDIAFKDPDLSVRRPAREERPAARHEPREGRLVADASRPERHRNSIADAAAAHTRVATDADAPQQHR